MTLNEGNEGIILLIPSGLWSPEKDLFSCQTCRVHGEAQEDMLWSAQASMMHGEGARPRPRSVLPGIHPRPAAVTDRSGSISQSSLARSPCPPLQSCASGCFPLQTQPATESFSSALHTVPAAKMSHHATHTLTRSTLHLKYPRAAGQNPAVCDL